MYIDKQNTFFYKQAVTANVSSDVVMNGNGGDAEKSLWLVIRLDKDVTGTPLFNLYTSNTEISPMRYCCMVSRLQLMRKQALKLQYAYLVALRNT